MYNISYHALRELMLYSMQIGRMDMANQLGVLSDNITSSDAKKIYKSRFTKWVRFKQITGNKQGGERTSRVYYSRLQLEILDRAENFMNYYK